MRQTTAPVTIAIVLVNCIVFAAIHIFISDAEIPRFLDEFGFNPTLFWLEQKVWQPLTSMFIHVWLVHFAFNMLAVWSVGTPLELTLGSGRFSFLYFVSGFTGSIFLMIFQPSLNVGAHGASGAVFGLLGALAIFYPNSRLLVFFIPMRAITAAAVLAVLSVLFYLLEQLTFIAHMAHLGGLVGGFLYAKFALGLEIGRSALSPTPGESLFDRARRAPSGSGPGAAPLSPNTSRADRAAKEAEILRLMKGISGEPTQTQPPVDAQSQAPSEPQTPPPAVNPPPAAPTPTPPPVDSPPPAGPSQSESPPTPGTGTGKRLKYDPQTGRFHLEE